MAEVAKAGEGRTVRRARAVLALGAGALVLAACATAPSRPGLGPSGPAYRPPADAGPGAGAPGLHGTDKPYQINGVWYYPHADPSYDVVGYASWYGAAFHNKHTADGEIFDQYALSAAHKTLPLPSLVEVTNLDNGRSIRLRLNDRGPFVGDRVLDVSRAAAEQLGFAQKGLTRVRVRYVGPAPAFAAPVTYAAAEPSPRPYAAPRAPSAASLDDSPDDAPRARPVQGQVRTAALAPLGQSSPAPAPFAPAAAPPPSAPDQDSPYAESSVDLAAGSMAPKRLDAPVALAAPRLAPAAPLAPDTSSSTATGLAPPPRPVAVASLEAPRPAAPTGPAAPPYAPSAPSAAAGYSVQAGAFSSRDNAERAAAQLGSSAAIRPLARNGQTLYRVVLAGYPDAGAAEAARARAAAAGFADARVVSTY